MTNEYTTKDSGKRVDFTTGSRRDLEEGKPRFDLIGNAGLLALATFIEQGEDQMADKLMRACFRMAMGDFDNSDGELDDWIALADLLERGAVKYGERNWELGQPTSRSFSSLLRHLMQWADGDDEEDHRAAVLFNMMSVIHVERLVLSGDLPATLLDHPRYRKAGKRYIESLPDDHVAKKSLLNHISYGGFVVYSQGVCHILDADAFDN